MKEMWGTTSLVTDYKPEKKKLLREVTDEKFKKEEEQKETELFDAWDYGLDSLTLNT
jgi:acyl carrier protein